MELGAGFGPIPVGRVVEDRFLEALLPYSTAMVTRESS